MSLILPQPPPSLWKINLLLLLNQQGFFPLFFKFIDDGKKTLNFQTWYFEKKMSKKRDNSLSRFRFYFFSLHFFLFGKNPRGFFSGAPVFFNVKYKTNIKIFHNFCFFIFAIWTFWYFLNIQTFDYYYDFHFFLHFLIFFQNCSFYWHFFSFFYNGWSKIEWHFIRKECVYIDNRKKSSRITIPLK